MVSSSIFSNKTIKAKVFSVDGVSHITNFNVLNGIAMWFQLFLIFPGMSAWPNGYLETCLISKYVKLLLPVGRQGQELAEGACLCLNFSK